MGVGDSIERLAELLKEHEQALTVQWIDKVAASLRGRATKAELSRDLGELYTSLIAALGSGSADPDAEHYGEARALLAELSRSRARRGFSPSETAVAVFVLKDLVFDVVAKDGSREAYQDFVTFSRVIDALGLRTFETYVRTREQVIAEQSEQLLELSTPVVKLWEGVVAVPLVGTLDSARTQVVMEKLLQTLVDTGSEHAIIDITGVPAVDTQVAQHLLKTVFAARLMGAECTISGIRPQIAQTIVTLGIEFGDITTKASLADALVHALRRSGMDMVRHPGRREP